VPPLDGSGRDHLGGRVADGDLLGQLVAEPVAQPAAATLAAVVVGQHPPRDAVQPEPGLVARRNLGAPAPGDKERLGDHVGSVLGGRGSAQRVARSA